MPIVTKIRNVGFQYYISQLFHINLINGVNILFQSK